MQAPSPTVPMFALHAPTPIQLSFDTWPAFNAHAPGPRQAPIPTLPSLKKHAHIPSERLGKTRGPQPFLLMLPELERQAPSPTQAPGCNPPVLSVQASAPIQAPAGGAASAAEGMNRTARPTVSSRAIRARD